MSLECPKVYVIHRQLDSLMTSLVAGDPILSDSGLQHKSICDTNLIIFDHLTPRGLAYWYMDDGGKLDLT